MANACAAEPVHDPAPKTFVGLKLEPNGVCIDLSDDDVDGNATPHYPEPCIQI